MDQLKTAFKSMPMSDDLFSIQVAMSPLMKQYILQQIDLPDDKEAILLVEKPRVFAS
jgi:hypothetical protein